MATFKSVQLTEGYRKYPIEEHGKLRFAYGNYVANVALAAADQIDLFRLPPGRKRVLPWLSRVSGSAFGAARTLNIGHRAYTKQAVPLTDEAEAGNAFVNALDVSGATNAVAFSTVLKYDMFSTQEQIIYATINGGTMPQNATLAVMLAYIYE